MTANCKHISKTCIFYTNTDWLQKEENYEAAWNYLPEYRREKAKSYQLNQDRIRSVAAGILLVTATMLYLNREKESLFDEHSEFHEEPVCMDLRKCIKMLEKMDDSVRNIIEHVAISPQEKPYYPDAPELHYNLTHAGSYAACIISDMPCGIDMEGNRKVNDATARRFYSEEEYAWMETAEDKEEKVDRFFRLWTLKEAYTKAEGTGIFRGIRKVQLIPNEGRLVIADQKMREGCTITEYSVGQFRLAAVRMK